MGGCIPLSAIAGSSLRPYLMVSVHKLHSTKKVAALAFVSFLCLPLLLAMWRPIPYVIERFTPDDAYYYLNTALNIAAGRGSTFDRINPTNGYHPLWMLVLVPVYKLFDGVELPLRVVLSIEVLLMLASMWLSFELARQYIPTCLALLSPLLLYVFVGLAGFYALESHLLIFVSLIAIAFALSRPHIFEPSKFSVDDIVWGVFLALIALSRLDAAFVFVSYACVIIALGVRAGRLSLAKLSSFSAPFALLIGIYLLWNRFHFGHWMPISGALKMTIPSIVLIPRHLFIKPVIVRMAISLAASVAYVSATLLSKPSSRLRQFHPPLLMLNIYVLLHACYTAFLQDWGVFPWYFALSLCSASLTLPALISLLGAFNHPKRIAALVAMCAALVLLAAFNKLALPSRHVGLRKLYEQAMWLKNNTEPDAICIAEDAGIIGYYSQRRVINLDGLINSYEYQEYLGQGRFADYLRLKGVQYFIATRGNPKHGEPFRYEAYSHLYNVVGGVVELQPEWRLNGAPIPTWKLRR
ncbi:MAG: hypothetical protein RMK18_00500 [Armatimonadota bacterium]|nr:hypothetical protein [Armatimonadota bacterium]MCX7776535.1 hypothetical protein [Armatimonadota bacterium]MDW8024334.1 hypothetical protein [Armatimonadota bacterium]